MSKSILIAIAGAWALCWALLLATTAQGAEDQAAVAKKWFIEVETISRLDQAAQTQHVPRLYREAYPALRELEVHGLPWGMVIDGKVKRSPEELADHILEQPLGGWGWFPHLASEACLRILGNHRQELAPLVTADIQCDSPAKKKRALQVIGKLKLTDYFEPVLKLFEADGELSKLAATTLRDLDDPRAIAPMIEKYPDLVTEMTFEKLRSLQTRKPADLAVIKLLDSDDAEVRWRAAYALAESGDGRLIPHAERLAKDEDPRVRQNAANIGFCLQGQDFERIKPTLVSLLADSDIHVKIFTAICFAPRQDTVCARTMLELTQDESVDRRLQGDIIQAIHGLTRTDFGYRPQHDKLDPISDNNKRGAVHFAEWIKKNVPASNN